MIYVVRSGITNEEIENLGVIREGSNEYFYKRKGQEYQYNNQVKSVISRPK